MPKYRLQITVPSEEEDQSSDLQEEMEVLLGKHSVFKDADVQIDPRNPDMGFPENMSMFLDQLDKYLNWLTMTSVENGMMPLAIEPIKKFEHAIVEIRFVHRMVQHSRHPTRKTVEDDDEVRTKELAEGTVHVPMTEQQLGESTMQSLHSIVHQVALIRRIAADCTTMSKHEMISFIKTHAHLLSGKDGVN